MAELFLGFTSGPGGFRKYVALKRILPDARSDESFERMFLDEARITAAFNHPNIGQVFELGQDGEGLFLAMEFIAGQNLNQVAGVCRRKGVALPAGYSLAVARDVCLALHYAHTFTTPAGKPFAVIHRDVAQKNVMVTYDGVVKLLDFGIAKARDAVGHTQAGVVKGTAGYMSPEQVRGEPLDGRSDLFSVGVMLHEMLTGQRLFSAKTEREEMRMILEAPIPVPGQLVAGLPADVSRVVIKALARNREERFASGRDMARAIEAAAGSLLFDSEQRAAFMHENFPERMEATRRLLGGGEDGGAGAESVEPSPKRQEARPAEREETKRPVQGQGARPPREPEAREAQPATRSVATTGRVVAQRREPMKGPGPTPPRAREAKSRLWMAGLALLVVGGGLGLGGLKLARMLEAQESAAPPVPVAELTRMRPIEQPAPAPAPVEAEPSTSPSAAEPEPQPPVEAREGKETPAPAKSEPSRGVKQGALTLIILPGAEVFLNGRSLGKTPLIKTPVPVGRHLLRIKGEDGKRRVLSVPIEAGKTAQFRLALTDIPER
jgi:serine/threonine-protein kinase